MDFSIKDKKILVIDTGLFLNLIIPLAQAGAKIRYFTPWLNLDSQFTGYAPGLGYEDIGIEKVFTFWDNVDWADMIMAPDVGFGAEIQYIRDHTNKPCFGAGNGDQMEQERWWMRNKQKELGLPTQKTTRVTGVPNLEKYLQENTNVFIKLDKFRGDTESFPAKNFESVKLHLDEVDVALGPFNEQYKFMVEPFIDGIEPGFDMMFNGKDWVRPYLWGVEQSKYCYIGKYVDELPTPLQLIADKLKPYLQSIGYRGAMSVETRITKDGTPYLIDVCSRFPSPLSAVFPEAMTNYPEVIWKIANGEDVRIKNKGQYVIAAPLETQHALKNFVKLDFPEEMSKYIKLGVSAKVEEEYFAVKGASVVYTIVDVGNDYHKLIEHAQELAKNVYAFELRTETLEGLKQIDEVVKDYPKFNMGKF